jgi:hypothetical protein
MKLLARQCNTSFCQQISGLLCTHRIPRTSHGHQKRQNAMAFQPLGDFQRQKIVPPSASTEKLLLGSKPLIACDRFQLPTSIGDTNGDNTNSPVTHRLCKASTVVLLSPCRSVEELPVVAAAALVAVEVCQDSAATISCPDDDRLQ